MCGPRNYVFPKWPAKSFGLDTPVLENICTQFPVNYDRGSLKVKVTDSLSAYHEFEHGTAEDPPSRGGRRTSNQSRLKRHPVGVVGKYEEGDASSGVVLAT
ncbi:hypothetical protein TNCV_4395731 [Trichonephila clavipes]|uniref:Uncharacterized protein n=1 Tax=Trichonephila clavipes TaxID=2585209 RepID=A0A8X6W4Z0_TRICX|nr:hypothetical protein TNCV_4395731 [Trichonephila clavipes]